MISDEAVEAAARALADLHVEHLLLSGHLDYRGSRSEAIGNYVEENWLLFETQARAALEAALPHLLDREKVVALIDRAIVFFDADGGDKFTSQNAADAILAHPQKGGEG